MQAQVYSLQEALKTAVENYGTIKAKTNYAAAAKLSIEQSRREYLPNLVVSAQQDYGTVNGQNGPLYGFGGYGVASSGLPLSEQNWNAAFGALYLVNFNWDVFTFGRVRERIKIAKASYEQTENDLAQEQFQHQIKVIAAYLNLLAAQRITISQQKNVERATTFLEIASTRALNGLIPGVDSSFASAEVSNANIALTKAIDFEQEQSNRLAVLLGIPHQNFQLDSTFIRKVPAFASNNGNTSLAEHPTLKFYQSRTKVSLEQSKYYRRMFYPTLTAFAIMQGRGSGFTAAYTQDQTAFTRNYGTGVTPTRGNYLLGLGINWNLASILRYAPQAKSQKLVTEGLQKEYELVEQQLNAQLALADLKIKNALANYVEAPNQVKSASEAYVQKSTLYKNGLATMVEVSQTLYALNRAEIDREIINNNVWQALLIKSAANGNLSLFLNELN